MNYIERYWRDAKPEDAIKEPPMVARFRAGTNQEWIMDTLQGIDRSEPSKWRGKDVTGRLCQVYDAPDPGEGWRLIDTANEKWQEGDEIYEQSTGTWRKRLTPFQDWALSVNRRRITPPVTYVPFTWEDREQLRGKRVLTKEPHRQVEFTCDEFQLNDDGSFFVGEFYSVWLCKNAVFTDTGKPVGKEVTQ